MLPADAAVPVQVAVGAPDDDGRRPVQVYARGQGDGAWTRHASGWLTAADRNPRRRPTSRCGRRPVRNRWTGGRLYGGLAAAGYGYGPAFRGLRAAWRRGDGRVRRGGAAGRAWRRGGFGVHPALLDAALHPAGPAGVDVAAVRRTCGCRSPGPGVTLSRVGGVRRLRVRLSREAATGTLSLAAADDSGAPVVSVDSVVLRPVARRAVGDGRCAGRRTVHCGVGAGSRRRPG